MVCGLRFADFGLWIADGVDCGWCGLRMVRFVDGVDCGLRFAVCGLRFVDCGLWIADGIADGGIADGVNGVWIAERSWTERLRMVCGLRMVDCGPSTPVGKRKIITPKSI